MDLSPAARLEKPIYLPLSTLDHLREGEKSGVTEEILEFLPQS